VVFEAMVKGPSNREYVYDGFDAIISAILCMTQTVIGTNEMCPTIGFDMREFLWRSDGSPVWDDLVDEFKEKIKNATCNEITSVDVTKNDSTVSIDITWNYDGVEQYIPIELKESTNAVSTELWVGNNLILTY
jgi:hypothetical protein